MNELMKQKLLLDVARLDVVTAAIKEAMPEGYPREIALTQIDEVRGDLADMVAGVT